MKTNLLPKIKELFTGPHRSFAWTVVVVLGIFLFVWTAGPGNTFIGWIKARMDISSTQRQIDEYRSRSAEMDNRINELRSNRDSLEKFAREKFFFSAPGEDIYIVNGE